MTLILKSDPVKLLISLIPNLHVIQQNQSRITPTKTTQSYTELKSDHLNPSHQWAKTANSRLYSLNKCCLHGVHNDKIIYHDLC